jgi:hypothetical protein
MSTTAKIIIAIVATLLVAGAVYYFLILKKKVGFKGPGSTQISALEFSKMTYQQQDTWIHENIPYAANFFNFLSMNWPEHMEAAYGEWSKIAPEDQNFLRRNRSWLLEKAGV